MNYKERIKKAQEEYENFTRLLDEEDPKHFIAIYGFAEILKAVDFISYKQELLRYLDERELSDELQETIIDMIGG